MNIAILMTSAPMNAIHSTFAGYTLLTDAELFNAMNGGQHLVGKTLRFHQDDLITQLEPQLLATGLKSVIVHTFNPMALNALEPDDKDNKNIHKTFYVYGEKSGFTNLMEYPPFIKKMEEFSLGEAVVDSYIETLVNDIETLHMNNENRL
jgi:hypothetical protein